MPPRPAREDLIGWHVNRDWDHAPDFYPASRFRDRFNRPDIVKRILNDLDEDKAIAEASQLAGAKPAAEIERILPPVITILSPGDGAQFSSDRLSIRYSLRSPSDLAISELTALVDGRPLSAIPPPGGVSQSAESEASVTLSGLPQRDITLSLAARAGGLRKRARQRPAEVSGRDATAGRRHRHEDRLHRIALRPRGWRRQIQG